MLDLLSDDMRRDPYPVYRQLAAESPVVHIAAADLWMLLDYESVKHALHARSRLVRSRISSPASAISRASCSTESFRAASSIWRPNTPRRLRCR